MRMQARNSASDGPIEAGGGAGDVVGGVVVTVLALTTAVTLAGASVVLVVVGASSATVVARASVVVVLGAAALTVVVVGAAEVSGTVSSAPACSSVRGRLWGEGIRAATTSSAKATTMINPRIARRRRAARSST